MKEISVLTHIYLIFYFIVQLSITYISIFCRLFCEKHLSLEGKPLVEALDWEVTSLRYVVGSIMSQYHKKPAATLQLTDNVKACLMKMNSELTRQGKDAIKVGF